MQLASSDKRRPSGYNLLNIPEDDFDNVLRQDSVQSDLLNLDELDAMLTRGASIRSGRSGSGTLDDDATPKRKAPFVYTEDESSPKASPFLIPAEEPSQEPNQDAEKIPEQIINELIDSILIV